MLRWIIDKISGSASVADENKITEVAAYVAAQEIHGHVSEPEVALETPVAVAPAFEPRMGGFCIYPFQSLNVMPAGTIKPCCAYLDILKSGNKPLSVYENAIPEIWNSAPYRDLRKAFVEGTNAPACDGCFALERQGLDSTRTARTQFWIDGVNNEARLTVDQLKTECKANDYAMSTGPETLDLDVGNLCNLKCRMCNSTYSSRIASDPVHSKWQGLPLLDTTWRGESLVIAPRPILGLTYEGFSDLIREGRTVAAFTNGSAAIRMNITSISVTKLSFALDAAHPAGLPLSIMVNEKEVFAGALPEGSWKQEFEILGLNQEELEIRVNSGTFKAEGQDEELGVKIREIKVFRAAHEAAAIVGSRLKAGQQWFQDSSFLGDELLGTPENIKMLNVIGGEPMLIKEVRFMMQRMINSGTAHNTILVFTTNGTMADQEWFDLCSKFKIVYVAVSIDGFGKVNDYIRFPSKWSNIQENLLKIFKQKNTHGDINVTVQAYNILNIVELLNFCDDNGISYRLTLLQWPIFLNVFVLPLSIRKIAAQRLRDYVKERKRLDVAREQTGHPKMLRHFDRALSIATVLESGAEAADEAGLAKFILMTNDLDKSRNQDIRAALPDLMEEMARAGIEWHGKLKYFSPK